MLFINSVKQEVKEKLTWLRLSFEMSLAEAIQQWQGSQALVLKPIRNSQDRGRAPYRSMRR
jgi:hypothetical protein